MLYHHPHQGLENEGVGPMVPQEIPDRQTLGTMLGMPQRVRICSYHVSQVRKPRYLGLGVRASVY